jgi:hypothetical protein
VRYHPVFVDGSKERTLIAELIRLAFAWGAMVGILWFWYWLLSNIGTF